ncbi:MAG: 2,3-bisphosphoglycerate-independent phosphoglycerate mutase, partial [Flavobacteriales bacterium]|nr:2,3-bisphosphoglycerate-independent phosphoglycerate mutase [Flavobacteriales bacterium]
MNRKLLLLILDGWGIGDRSKSDAVFNAETPVFEELLNKYPHSTLKTSGLDVGLPEGQMGNSEVGHLNIGAGRVVHQDLVKINNAITDESFSQNLELRKAIEYCVEHQKPIHLMGLVSDGGVHASQEHLHYLCKVLNDTDIPQIFIHAFLDGRDTDPLSGKGFISRLLDEIRNYQKVHLSSIVGRYFAMDRDLRWGRTKKAYELLLNKEGDNHEDPL